MWEGAGGEWALSRVGVTCGSQSPGGFLQKSSSTGTIAPCAGASCGARAAVTQTCAESGALLAVLQGHQKLSPSSSAG